MSAHNIPSEKTSLYYPSWPPMIYPNKDVRAIEVRLYLGNTVTHIHDQLVHSYEIMHILGISEQLILPLQLFFAEMFNVPPG